MSIPYVIITFRQIHEVRKTLTRICIKRSSKYLSSYFNVMMRWGSLWKPPLPFL